MTRCFSVVLFLFVFIVSVYGGYPVRPVPFTNVTIEDSFWTPRQELNHKHSIPFAFEQSEKTGRIENFKLAAGKAKPGYKYTVPLHNDGDFYKGIEAAAYDLQQNPDPKMETYLDELITIIAEAQEKDGYLYTGITCQQDFPELHRWAHGGKWKNLEHSHELYSAGHLFEAAAAHYAATGKKNLLDIAVKLAGLLVTTFGMEEGQIRDVPGHEVIEMGLCKLYHVTGKEEYLKLAKFFIDLRGREDLRSSRNKNPKKMYGELTQDHKPLTKQDEAVGHAVRATYLYAGAADVAVLTGDQQLIAAMKRIWENTVAKKLSIHGGLGAAPRGEAFDKNYVLPNFVGQTYNETCAQIGGCYWHHRMFLLEPDAKYYDVLERTIYNGLISGISLSGDRFFYPNPLASRGGYNRQPWFYCACCPQNLMRFLASLGGYIYAVKNGTENIDKKISDTLFVGLYIGNQADVDIAGQTVHLRLKSDFPNCGNVRLSIHPKNPATWKLALRIPGWAAGKPVPSDLYAYSDTKNIAKPIIQINNETVSYEPENGFAVIERQWKDGDLVTIQMEMPLNRVICNELVVANRGRVAFERGPLVYCFESIDNDNHLFDLIPDNNISNITVTTEEKLFGAESIMIDGSAVLRNRDGSVYREKRKLKMIPYCVWDNRGNSAMQVWMSGDEKTVEILPKQSSAQITVSFARSKDDMPKRIRFINDGKFPNQTETLHLQHFDWWSHLGTTEWVCYDFEKPISVSQSGVYWFEDEGKGQCRLPQAWKLFYKDGQDWKEVVLKDSSAYGTQKGILNTIEFAPVKTESLRIEVTLPNGFSSGLYEWVVE
ncbi:MAG: glycoside hydrolase family 127 protein [Planctomycetaceae bacterium]|jgi:DUF1680 family protein|nr:glycoside hydrolase family 127 protein [Planctomycetaceae bacterium]